MRMKSTGLGKTELIGYFEKIEKKDGFFIIHMRTTEPVRWHVRAAISPQDLHTIVFKLLPKQIINGAAISLLLKRGEQAEVPDY